MCSCCFFVVVFLTTVLSHLDFCHRKFGFLSQGKASSDRVALPNLRCVLGVFGVSVIHGTLTWTTGSLTCVQILMHVVTAHRSVWTHVRESWLGEKSLAAPGTQTCCSSVPVWHSTNWATSPQQIFFVFTVFVWIDLSVTDFAVFGNVS